MNNMFEIYINHYDILTDRKQYLQSVLKECVWVTEPSKDTLTEEIKKEWYLESVNECDKKCLPFHYRNIFRKLKDSDIACSLGHIKSWELFVKTDKSYGIFFEDDIVLNCENFEQKIENILQNSPLDLDVLFIGGGFEHDYVTKTKSIVNENFHLKYHPATNCACSYVLTQNAANKLLSVCKPFSLSIDFELNYLFYLLNFNVYHYIPYFVEEGSKTGKYQSSQIFRNQN